MLRSLYIENVAVARRVSLDFGDGFTVMTGETGAGKSVLIDCLALITGGKSQREMIRSGEERAMISAVFTDVPQTEALTDAGIFPDDNGEMELIRTLTSDGRSTVKINRRVIPLAVLREIGPYLISIQSQSEARNLLDKSFHLSMLDEYAKTEDLLRDYSPLYTRLGELTASAQSLRESMREKNMLVDILKYQIKEIDAARLSDPEEDVKLAASRIKIKDIDVNSRGSKSFKIIVTDPSLIALTGGIVRGMSGSPIIQDGKIVGAVTHVMIADPTEGYGIFIENMLNAAKENQAQPKAA